MELYATLILGLHLGPRVLVVFQVRLSRHRSVLPVVINEVWLVSTNEVSV